jgi:ABC-2 type transport system permease protein
MTARGLVLRQALLEQRAFWRNPQYAVLTFAMPLGVLLVLGATIAGHDLPGNVPEVRLFVPAMLAFGLLTTAYANLAERLAVQRSDGVLKRIAVTPLPRPVYLASQIASTLVTTAEIAVVTLLLGVIVFGAAPRPAGVLLLVLGIGLGTACLAALAFAISAAIPSSEAAGAITTASYLPFAILSGVFSTTLRLPAWLNAVMGGLPVRPLVGVFQACYDPVAGVPAADLAVLTAWAVIGIILARRYFRWQP